MDIAEILRTATDKVSQMEERLTAMDALNNDYQAAHAMMRGENAELRAQIVSLQAALNVAVDAASTRKAMVYELTAQISMLGKLFMHCGDEVIKIVAALPKQPEPEEKPKAWAEQAEEDSRKPADEVETLGPFIGVSNEDEALKAMIATSEPPTQEVDTPTIPFAKPPEGRRTHLLSETVIPSPAFLSHNGLTRALNREMNAADMSKLTYLERKRYVKDGTIPARLRKSSSG